MAPGTSGLIPGSLLQLFPYSSQDIILLRPAAPDLQNCSPVAVHGENRQNHSDDSRLSSALYKHEQRERIVRTTPMIPASVLPCINMSSVKVSGMTGPPMQRYFVAKTTSIPAMFAASAGQKEYIAIAMDVVATPLPPRKPRQNGKSWPMVQPSPA